MRGDGTGRARESLRARRAELADRLERIDRDRRRQREPLEGDWHEAAIQKENDEVLDALDESVRAELAEIDLALERLERGQYGFCAACGRAISAARLRALPATSRCSACARKG